MNRKEFQDTVEIGDELVFSDGKTKIFNGYEKCNWQKNSGERCQIKTGNLYCLGRILLDKEMANCFTQNEHKMTKEFLIVKKDYLEKELFEI